jgi:hypothetical protein
VRQILRDIRGVAGVTGVAIIVKSDGRVERLFPAAFTERHTEELTRLITAAYQRLRGFRRLSLRFERVVIYVFNQPDYLLFASVLPDCEEQMFETIVKSKLPVIGRRLAREASAARDKEGTLTAVPSADQPADQVIEVLISIYNALTHVVGARLGRAKVAAAWRQARDLAATANDALTALEVDAGGKLNVRKGRVLASSVENMRSLAGLVQHFFNALETAGAEAEEAFYSLIEPQRELLEEHGFYLFLRETVSPTRNARSRGMSPARQG